jgi:hypothetical protein
VAQYGAVGDATDPQSIFANYLNHTAARALVGPYLNSSGIARDYGLPLLMFETNTASCSGFLGISDSFGAALWALDYALQMAYVNFSGALLHSGGRNAYYNVSICCQPSDCPTNKILDSHSLVCCDVVPLWIFH